MDVKNSNPNNCQECDHWKMQRNIEEHDPNETKLHCYMFKTEPDDVCMQHSARKAALNFPIQTSIHNMVEELRKSGAIISDF